MTGAPAMEEDGMADVNPIPEGYPVVTPYLCVDGAAEAIDFYVDVLGARERMRMAAPGGKVGHAELELGNSVIMLSDEWPEMGARSPKAYGGSAVTLHVYVQDVDAAVERAVAAGATIRQPVEDRFYGDRSGGIVDPWGHVWNLASHVEDVAPDELARRAEAAMRDAAG
jgi:PhnB protein